MSTLNIDPKDVKITFGGVEFTGHAEGSFIEVGPAYEHVPSFEGASIKLTLLADPDDNTLLSRLWSYDVDAFLRREDRRYARRVRMARKRRRGWA